MDWMIDKSLGGRLAQTFVEMRDGVRLNTFVFLPEKGAEPFPAILHRTPYGIAAADAKDRFDISHAWLPSRRGHDATFFEGVVRRASVRNSAICGVDSMICHGIPLANWRPDNRPFWSHLNTVWVETESAAAAP